MLFMQLARLTLNSPQELLFMLFMLFMLFTYAVYAVYAISSLDTG